MLLHSREGGGTYSPDRISRPNPAEPAGVGSLEGGVEQPSPCAARLLLSLCLLLLHRSAPHPTASGPNSPQTMRLLPLQWFASTAFLETATPPAPLQHAYSAIAKFLTECLSCSMHFKGARRRHGWRNSFKGCFHKPLGIIQSCSPAAAEIFGNGIWKILCSRLADPRFFCKPWWCDPSLW